MAEEYDERDPSELRPIDMAAQLPPEDEGAFRRLADLYESGDGSINDANERANYAYLLAKARGNTIGPLIACTCPSGNPVCPVAVTPEEAEIDHIVSRDDDGPYHQPWNLRALSKACNDHREVQRKVKRNPV